LSKKSTNPGRQIIPEMISMGAQHTAQTKQMYNGLSGRHTEGTQV